MGSTRRSFTSEYKSTAVEYVLDDGRPIVEVARNIGVSPTTLGKWVKLAKDKRGDDSKPLNINEREELQQLRQEVRELKMQLDFAKKVATWFAKDPQ
jgi:transposase